MPTFAATSWQTSPWQSPLSMTNNEYNAIRTNLRRLIATVMGDNLVQVLIDNYDDAQVTEPLMQPFETVRVFCNGQLSRLQLTEMDWYGCRLISIVVTNHYMPEGSGMLLYYDARQYANDYLINRRSIY